MPKKVAINGFGRIGRIALRQILKRDDIQIVAINSRSDISSHAHLLKYDSSYGILEKEVKIENDYLIIENNKIKVFNTDNPNEIDWNSVDTDIVIESTGVFCDKKSASAHLGGSVKKVIISAPGKDMDYTFVMGVNDEKYDPKNHNVISNASCTTNCLAPVAKVLDENFGIKKGQMTTIHAFTNDQNILDNSHRKDPRRARTATRSIIPTSTGAAQAVSLVLPQLEGKLTGLAVRTPSDCVSLVDLVCELEKNTSKEELNEIFEKYSKNDLKGILGIEYKPLVSIDFKANELSSIVDADYTSVIGGNLVKILSWYDNEWGYVARLLDLTSLVASKL
jgi:glyceraldehyde 3-phosphate dehydrogenase